MVIAVTSATTGLTPQGFERPVLRGLYRMLRDRLFQQLRLRLLLTPVTYGPSERLIVDDTARVPGALFNTASGDITIGAYVFFGHGVSVLAARHDYMKFGQARLAGGPVKDSSIVIEEGVWIASNATILGPCRIGRDAVVGAGSVVTKDVPSGVFVAGSPAKVVRTLR